MIYGTQDGATTLIVGAAASFEQLERLHADAVLGSARAFQREYQPSLTEMLMDDRFHLFRKPPYVFDFADEGRLLAFARDRGITLVPLPVVIDRHLSMISALAADPYLSPDADQRMIEEVLGIDEHDPWDQRSDEQRQQDKELQKEAEAAKKAGKLSGDSFAPGQGTDTASEVAVTDIRTTRHADGSITIDDVLAVKGAFDNNGKPLEPGGAGAEPPAVPGPASAPETFFRFVLDSPLSDQAVVWWLHVVGALPARATAADLEKAVAASGSDWFALRDERAAHRLYGLLRHEGAAFRAEVVDAAQGTASPFGFDLGKARHITPGGWIAIYHRVEVADRDLEAVVKVLIAEGERQSADLLAANVAARGQGDGSCWLACATKAGAERLARVIADDPWMAAPAIEVYGVNDLGERLVPKGVEIVEAVAAPEPPRPWNEQAATWSAMDADARKKDAVRIKGAEFIFCGSYRGPGDGCICICFITPRSYFAAHEAMWEGPLDIALPQDLKPIRPGTFQTRSRDWIALSQDLSARGMVESLALQLWVNTRD